MVKRIQVNDEELFIMKNDINYLRNIYSDMPNILEKIIYL